MSNQDEGYMEFPFNYVAPVEINIEEIDMGVAIISGTLLKEGISRNKRRYTIQEMENIAKRAIGMPIQVGTVRKFDPTSGKIKILHNETDEARIGKIMETNLDEETRTVKFIGQIVNTDEHPDIITRIKKGWGISVGGLVKKAHYIMDKVQGMVMDVKDMLVTHVSLIEPNIVRGQQVAQVENVSIHEVMEFALPPINIEIVGCGSKIIHGWECNITQSLIDLVSGQSPEDL